jgi:hypothetical protein
MAAKGFRENAQISCGKTQRSVAAFQEHHLLGLIRDPGSSPAKRPFAGNGAENRCRSGAALLLLFRRRGTPQLRAAF